MVHSGAWEEMVKDNWAIGNTNRQENPIQIIAKNVLAASSNYKHTMLIKTDGSLWGNGVE